MAHQDARKVDQAEPSRIGGFEAMDAVTRELGERSPELHAAFWEKHRDAIEAAKQTLYEGGGLTSEAGAMLDELDRLSAQKDSAWSGLYWETDLDAALARARAEGKLVLTLRMLGRLDEEFSCANSRFFRTVLYANEDVARVLDRFYVLHWSMERPMPRVRIDFGDGREIETTLTGNSMHAVLSPDGDVLHGMPGLYPANEFVARLVRFPLLWQEEMDAPTRGTAWAERAGIENDPGLPQQPHYFPDAGDANRLSMNKAVWEAPLLSRLGVAEDHPADRFTAWYVGSVVSSQSSMDAKFANQARFFGSGHDAARLDASDLSVEAQQRLREIDASLGSNTVKLMRAQNPSMTELAFARLRFLVWDALAKEEGGNRQGLEESIETIRRNPERIGYGWPFRTPLPSIPREGSPYADAQDRPQPTPPAEDATPAERLDWFFARVYAEVFYTPRTDSWLGLRREGIYDGHWHAAD